MTVQTFASFLCKFFVVIYFRHEPHRPKVLTEESYQDVSISTASGWLVTWPVRSGSSERSARAYAGMSRRQESSCETTNRQLKCQLGQRIWRLRFWAVLNMRNFNSPCHGSNIQYTKHQARKNLTKSRVTGELTKFLHRWSNCKLGNTKSKFVAFLQLAYLLF